jgi:hypothetical protein
MTLGGNVYYMDVVRTYLYRLEMDGERVTSWGKNPGPSLGSSQDFHFARSHTFK